MNDFRFSLERYHGRDSRFVCPSCKDKRRTFVRYIDQDGQYIFPAHVGRCNREDSCGYHFTPKDYFKETGDIEILTNCEKYSHSSLRKVKEETKREVSYIDHDIMERSKRCYDQNVFVSFLKTIFSDQAVGKLLARYHVGTSKRWDGSTVFWQVDAEGRVHTGKIMLYKTDGHRDHGNGRSMTSWVHSVLGKKDFNLEQCFFGEHLLVDSEKPVALVESEKTAIIASEVFPEYIWIASGGKSGCLNSRMHVLVGRDVVMFPDLKATTEWQAKAARMRALGINVEVSTFMEDYANDEERSAGLDIADYLIKYLQQRKNSVALLSDEEFLERMTARYPAISFLVDSLQLEVVPYQ